MMKKTKLSQWHDGNVKPVRAGVYQRIYNEGTELEVIVYCKFDKYWHVYARNADSADKKVANSRNIARWREIVKDEK